MAVPKRKTTKSKRGMRRSHHALSKINIVVDQESGEFKLPHHMSMKDGTYKGREVLDKKVVEEDEDDE